MDKLKEAWNWVCSTVIGVLCIAGFIAFVIFLFWLDKVRFIF